MVALSLQDAVVVDHERRAVSVAQMPGQAEFRVVAIAGDAADQHGTADDIDDSLRAGDLEIVGANREAELGERFRLARISSS